MDTPQSLEKKRQAAEAAVDARKAAARVEQRENAEAARIAAAEARAEAALKVAEKANLLNRILIVITASVGFLGVLVDFFANMPAIAANLQALFQ